MKLLKKQLSTAIAIALVLTIAATFITALPVAFGQVKIQMQGGVRAFPSPVGINQTITIEGYINPPPLIVLMLH